MWKKVHDGMFNNKPVKEHHENEHDSSFIFSESMLDEFIDKDI